jgi:hypothetical protein
LYVGTITSNRIGDVSASASPKSSAVNQNSPVPERIYETKTLLSFRFIALARSLRRLIFVGRINTGARVNPLLTLSFLLILGMGGNMQNLPTLRARVRFKKGNEPEK